MLELIQCWYSLRIVTPVVSKGLPSRKEEEKRKRKRKRKERERERKKKKKGKEKEKERKKKEKRREGILVALTGKFNTQH